MSILASKLEAVRGEDRKIWHGPNGITVRQQFDRLELQSGRAYEVRALLLARVFVREPDGITDEQIRDAKRHLIEEVFGEFRRHLMGIESALDEWDIDTARKRLKELEQSMFDPGSGAA